jgi:hypothetical protein
LIQTSGESSALSPTNASKRKSQRKSLGEGGLVQSASSRILFYSVSKLFEIPLTDEGMRRKTIYH